MEHDAEAASTLLYTEYLFGFIHADNVIIETDPSCWVKTEREESYWLVAHSEIGAEISED